jgi:hypothetical protein
MVNWSPRNPIGWFTLADLGYRSPTNVRGWDPNVFPGWTDALDWTDPVQLAAKRAAWRAAYLAYLPGVIARTTAVAGQGLISWVGFTGLQFDEPVSYPGDPRYYPPEVTEQAVVDGNALITAAGLKPGVIIRPTGFTETPPGSGNYTLTYPADPVAEMEAKIDYTRGIGSRIFYVDSSVKQLSEVDPMQFFTRDDLLPWATAYPDCLFLFEFLSPSCDDLPNVNALCFAERLVPPLDPGGYSTIVPWGHFQAPERDFHAAHWTDYTLDYTNPTVVTEVGNHYARGAIPLLSTASAATEPHQSTYYQAWLARYLGNVAVDYKTLIYSRLWALIEAHAPLTDSTSATYVKPGNRRKRTEALTQPKHKIVPNEQGGGYPAIDITLSGETLPLFSESGRYAYGALAFNPATNGVNVPQTLVYQMFVTHPDVRFGITNPLESEIEKALAKAVGAPRLGLGYVKDWSIVKQRVEGVTERSGGSERAETQYTVTVNVVVNSSDMLA